MKNNADLVKLWIEKAENDLMTAVHVLTIRPKPPVEIVCFHAQQCAEKYLKAAVLKLGFNVQKTHNLGDIVALCSGKNSGFMALKKDANKLTPYAVEARYPGAMEGINIKEARDAVKSAKNIKAFVIKEIF